MLKFNTLIILFLFILLATTCVARSEYPQLEIQRKDVENDEKIMRSGVEETRCEEVAEKDDCLMRRTLAAHTDYIYSQDLKP